MRWFKRYVARTVEQRVPSPAVHHSAGATVDRRRHTLATRASSWSLRCRHAQPTTYSHALVVCSRNTGHCISNASLCGCRSQGQLPPGVSQCNDLAVNRRSPLSACILPQVSLSFYSASLRLSSRVAFVRSKCRADCRKLLNPCSYLRRNCLQDAVMRGGELASPINSALELLALSCNISRESGQAPKRMPDSGVSMSFQPFSRSLIHGGG